MKSPTQPPGVIKAMMDARARAMARVEVLVLERDRARADLDWWGWESRAPSAHDATHDAAWIFEAKAAAERASARFQELRQAIVAANAEVRDWDVRIREARPVMVVMVVGAGG